MKSKSVNVFVSGKNSGEVFRSQVEEDVFLFSYRDDAKIGEPVSLTMPVVKDPYDSMGTIHPIFEMNLPEGMLRHKLEAMFSKVVANFDSLTLLEIIGKSQIGRLRYSSGDTVPEEVPVQSIRELLTYKGAGELFNQLMEKYAAHSGISGMQPKVLVRDETKSVARITDKGATHIVKSFDPREHPELAANEFFSMQAARYAGLPTAHVQLSDNRQLLIVDRFDKSSDGDYLGFEDFCVLSGMRAGGRYSSSYEELAKKVSTYVAPEHCIESMAQLFGSVALCCAIRNGDGHLKNFGVLYDSLLSNVRLAPVYDMLSTVPYQPSDILALELGGSKAFPSRAQLVQFGRQACGLPSRKVEGVLGQVCDGVEAAIQDMLDYARAHPDFEGSAAHFRNVFEHGVAGLANAPRK